MADGFTWTKSPEAELLPGMDRYAEQLLEVIQAVASEVGKEMQDTARRDASWENISGAARDGLVFAVDGFGLDPIIGEVTQEAEALNTDSVELSGDGNTLILVLGHTTYYGKFLELLHSQRYAIVMSTIQGHLADLESKLKAALED